MKFEKGFQASCSEAVFRFYTLDPEKIRIILQAISDTVKSKYPGDEDWVGDDVPLLKTAEEYDTGWNGQTEYRGSLKEKYEKQENKIWKDRDSGKITDEEAREKCGKLRNKMLAKIYPNTILKACAGLGDNEAVIRVERDKGSFTLNIGNNDISDSEGAPCNWVEVVKNLGIVVEEAEYSKELSDIARDCTCGITFFDDYKNLKKDPETEEEE